MEEKFVVWKMTNEEDDEYERCSMRRKPIFIFSLLYWVELRRHIFENLNENNKKWGK